MTMSSAEATITVVSALLTGLACGLFLGWFRGYTARDKEQQ